MAERQSRPGCAWKAAQKMRGSPPANTIRPRAKQYQLHTAETAMAEAIGVVASCAQLVHLSGTLLAGGYGFLSQVARAPVEMRSLLTEAAAVNSLLGQLQAIADNAPNSATVNALTTLEGLGVFQECRTTLQFIQTALTRCQQDAGKDLRNFGRRLAWPFKEKETKDAVQRLHRLRGVLANALDVDAA